MLFCIILIKLVNTTFFFKKREGMYTNKITAMAWAKLNFPEQIEALKLVFHLFASEFYYFLLYFLHHWDKSDKAVVWIFVN